MLKSALVVGALLLSGMAWAGAPKVTGEIQFINGGLEAYSAVSVHADWGNQTAGGWFTYSDVNGAYTLDVQCVSIDVAAGTATFVGVVTESTRTDIVVGNNIQIWLVDNGKPGQIQKAGGTPDGIQGNVGDCAKLGTAPPGPMLPAIAGNITVHDK
jgi:hypothetical protein